MPLPLPLPHHPHRGPVPHPRRWQPEPRHRRHASQALGLGNHPGRLEPRSPPLNLAIGTLAQPLCHELGGDPHPPGRRSLGDGPVKQGLHEGLHRPRAGLARGAYPVTTRSSAPTLSDTTRRASPYASSSRGHRCEWATSKRSATVRPATSHRSSSGAGIGSRELAVARKLIAAVG